MMKKYKNIILAFLLYIVAILISYIPMGITRNFYNSIALILVVILILAGIFLGFKSIKAKESTWLGHLTIIIGALILVSPFIIMYIGFRI